MSTSLIQTASAYNSLGNPLYITVDSTLNTEDGFEYIMDLEQGAASIARLTAVPSPNFSYGVFDVSRVLDDTVSYTFEPDTDDPVIDDVERSLAFVTASFGERYYNGSGNLVTNTGQDTFTFGILNAYQPYHKFIDFDINDYDKSVLSNLNETAKVYASESLFLHYLDLDDEVTNVAIKTYNESDALIGDYNINVSSEGIYKIIGAGTKQLTNASSSNYTVVTGSTDIITDDVARYDILFESASVAVTTYNVDASPDCYPYDDNRVRVLFLNELGGMDGYTFTMKNRKTLRTSKESYKNKSGTLTANGMRLLKSDAGQVDYQIDGETELQLNSNWLTDNEAEWLVELFNSPVVFVESEEYGIVRARVTDNTYEVRKKLNEKLIRISISLELSVGNVRR